LRIPRFSAAVALALAAVSPAVAAADVGTISEYPIPTADSLPRGITAGPDGRLWFTENAGNKIARITTSGQITAGDEIATPTAFVGPSGITVGPDGNLWFTEFAGGANSRIGRIPPTATSSSDILEIPVPTANSSPEGITAGPDGRIWFTEYGSLNGGRIGVLATTATMTSDITEFGIAGGGIPNPYGIVNGPGGQLWFTAFGGAKIGHIAPPGADVPTGDQVPLTGSPLGITVGPDGNLWAAEQDTSKIARVTPAGVVTEFPTFSPNRQPFGIAAGPDGRIWFTEAGGTTNHIGVMTTDGVMTAADEYAIPTDNANPLFITAGPDNRMWFTEANGNKVGAITTGAAAASFALTVAKSGTGTVTSDPAGISCGTVCSGAYTPGTSVTLTAAPDAGSTFAGWSGDCAGSSTCTVTMSQARAVTAAFTQATGPAPGSVIEVGCTANTLTLTDVFPKGRRTRLTGVAPSGAAGKKVALVSTWNGHTVARATVRADLTFSAVAPLPPARLRLTNRARYVARLGAKRSRVLKFARRMYTTAVTNQGRTITFGGTVTRPLDKPPQPVTIRASASCSSIGAGKVVATVKPSASGAFTARFDLPAGQTTVYLRAQTRVRKHAGSSTTFPTFTLIRGVKLAP
jgi:streptogramin lyase